MRAFFTSVGATWTYIVRRFHEMSTYMFLMASLPALAYLPDPWSWIGFGLALACALTPDFDPLARIAPKP